jgi:MFS family permease
VNGVIRRLGGMLLPSSDVGRTLAIGAGIDSLGTGMFFASFALYFVGDVGIAATEVALATTLAGAVALLAPVPLGRLADRLGTGSFYVALLLLRGIGYGCFAFVSDFTGFLVLTVLLTAADRSSSPIQQAVVTALIGGQDRTRTMASIRAVRNVGLTVGFLLVGAAFAATEPFVFTAIFVGNGFSFVVVAVMVRHVPSKAGSIVERATSASTATAAAGVRSPLRDRWFMVFTVGNGVLSLYDSVLIVLLPIWVIEHTAVPVALVPVLRSTRC